MVQIQGHRVSMAMSSIPSKTIRTTFRGSNPSTPDAGHKLAQAPQVKQVL
jgi:hypothetical protein